MKKQPAKQNKKNSLKKDQEQEFILKQSNYYSAEANQHFMSKSLYWNFLGCEAAALAQLKGEYNAFQDETPLLVGNYLHSYFESEESHKSFLDVNKKKLYKYGKPEKGLKKQFTDADKMIKALKDDPSFPYIYKGNKEAIVTGKINGIQWMGKIDCLNLDAKNSYFVDLKTVDDFHKKHWDDGQHKFVNFAQQRGYILQMAIYKELIKQTFGINARPFIIAVSKQSTPDKAIYSIPDEDMQEQLNELQECQEHIRDVIKGTVKPIPCGHCDYCRMHKTLGSIQSIDDIEIF
ncbi:hypothetical protein BGL36_05785 [Fructilactobacillus lindneri]|nr:hypothetical protein BGL35_06155 [Fructilactobacillus lindneri]POH05990.1 hypothetical protein BGL36_05785 [Fructilactobacillus lindneri]POH22898.1 hypothetical protein BHU33_06155 [Fructilactobacillus lindneri DSM 20690 = JCM 11027]